MNTDRAKRLNELEEENARLKRTIADQALDIDMLKELNRGNSEPSSPPGRGRPPGRSVRGVAAPGPGGGSSSLRVSAVGPAADPGALPSQSRHRAPPPAWNQLPAVDYVKWHTDEVFKGGPLEAG